VSPDWLNPTPDSRRRDSSALAIIVLCFWVLEGKRCRREENKPMIEVLAEFGFSKLILSDPRRLKWQGDSS